MVVAFTILYCLCHLPLIAIDNSDHHVASECNRSAYLWCFKKQLLFTHGLAPQMQPNLARDYDRANVDPTLHNYKSVNSPVLILIKQMWI